MMFCKTHSPLCRVKQQGVALISAVLIVALATAIAVSMSFDQTIIVQKSSHLVAKVQTNQFIYGLEDWVQTILIKDENDSKTDHLSEDWATPVPPLPIDRGYLSGFLEDEQAKFNLNSLLDSKEQLTRFRLLCEQLDVPQTFIEPLLDWLDEDIDVRYPDGAEDDYYSGLDTAYRTGNRLMHDVSELLLVKDMDQETFDKLRPFVTVLPEATSLNVNTLSEEIFLSLDGELNNSHFERYLEEREDEGFSSVSDMTKKLQINIEEKGLDVSTNYFLLNGVITQGELTSEFETLIKRDSKKTLVLQRRLGL